MLKILTAGVIAKALTVFSKSKNGLDLGINDEMIKAISTYLEKDYRIEKEILKNVESARKHDIKIGEKTDIIVNNIRGLIRPLCTVVAITWYLYAKLHNIEFNNQDYTMVGGILTFWFGFRSLDKKSGV